MRLEFHPGGLTSRGPKALNAHLDLVSDGFTRKQNAYFLTNWPQNRQHQHRALLHVREDGSQAVSTRPRKGSGSDPPGAAPPLAAEQSGRNPELEVPVTPQHPCSHLLQGPGGRKSAETPWEVTSGDWPVRTEDLLMV